jgi:hypothetical protein
MQIAFVLVNTKKKKKSITYFLSFTFKCIPFLHIFLTSFILKASIFSVLLLLVALKQHLKFIKKEFLVRYNMRRILSVIRKRLLILIYEHIKVNYYCLFQRKVNIEKRLLNKPIIIKMFFLLSTFQKFISMLIVCAFLLGFQIN